MAKEHVYPVVSIGLVDMVSYSTGIRSLDLLATLNLSSLFHQVSACRRARVSGCGCVGETQGILFYFDLGILKRSTCCLSLHFVTSCVDELDQCL